MKKEFVQDIISISDPVVGFVSKYLFKMVENPKKSIEYKTERIEEVLGLSKKSLNKKELDLINHILEIASNKNQSIDNIGVECSELKKVLKISNNELEDIKFSLDGFLEFQIAMNNYCVCKLNYSIFWKTNYLEIISNDSLNFEFCYTKIIKLLYNEKRHSEEEIDALSFKELFTVEQINFLLAYIEEISMSKYIDYRRPQTIFYYRSFFIDKGILYKEYEKLHNI